MDKLKTMYTKIMSIAFAIIIGLSVQATGAAWPQAPGYYRMQLGDFRVTVLSDGTALRDLPTIMSKPSEVSEALGRAHEQLPVQISVNCFLIDTGTKKILVDTGAGELYGPTTGHLVDNLRATGYEPKDIDAVLLTHIHGDHSGGLTIAGQRVFPNAVVYVDLRDPDFWLDAAAETRVPNFKTTFQQSHQTVDPYVQAGKLRPFDGPTELFPGITSVPEYGHTPGMSGYMIESRGQRLLVWGDIIHAAEVQFRDPSVTIEYDVDASEAIAARRKTLAAAADEGFLVAGAHISFPGLGHVMRSGNGFAWAARPYSMDP